jgi:hypothetical protein
MSKQSRAKSRRHKKPTGAVATFERSIRYMPEDRLYKMLSELLDDLHKALCDRRTFKSRKFLDLFYLRHWNDLEYEVALKNSASDNRAKALEIIPKVRAIFNRFDDKGVNV